MQQYVIQYDILAAVIVGIMLVAHIFLPFKNVTLRKIYMKLLVTVFLSCLFDIASAVMLSRPGTGVIYGFVLYVVTSLYYIIHVIPPYYVCCYIYYCIHNETLVGKLSYIIQAPVIVGEILLIFNPLFNFMFSIENGVLYHGPLFGVLYLVMGFYLIVAGCMFVINYKILRLELKLVILFYIIGAIGVLAVQYFFPEQLLECAGMVSILLVVYFAIQCKDMVDEAVRKEAEVAEVANIANRAKSEFLANMSHDIRTPINTMLGMNKMIIRKTDSAEIKKYAYSAERSGRVLLALVNDILDYSKIESGTMIIHKQEYMVQDLIMDLAEEIKERCQNKGLEFELDIDPKLPCKLLGDPIRLRQVMINLLTNAVKYTQKGFVKFKVTYKRISADELYLQVSVKDSGIGIKPEDLDKLAIRFQRLEPERNSGVDGVGLGLCIVTEILSMMDSELRVESQWEVGSEFSFEIKQPIIDNISIGKNAYVEPEEDTAEERYEISEAKVLVVDDNEMNLQVIRDFLKSHKIKIVTVDNGKEALKACEKIEFDLILMDYMMPHMDGRETLLEYKKRDTIKKKDTPVIVLTANVIPGMRERYIEEGFEDYLNKPVENAALEAVLKKYLPMTMESKA